MAGMARRGSHSARHRAGRRQPGAPQATAPGPVGEATADPGYRPPDQAGFARRRDEQADFVAGSDGGTQPRPARPVPPGARASPAVPPGVRRAPQALSSAAPAPQRQRQFPPGPQYRPGPRPGPPRTPGYPGQPRQAIPPGLAKPGSSRPPNRAPARPAPPSGPRKIPRRSRSTVIKAASVASVALIVIIAGLTGVGQSDPAVAISVKDFLLAWQSGDYTAAAAMTTGLDQRARSHRHRSFLRLGRPWPRRSAVELPWRLHACAARLEVAGDVVALGNRPGPRTRRPAGRPHHSPASRTAA
jgi:hypothetical protein